MMVEVMVVEVMLGVMWDGGGMIDDGREIVQR
jgi:hypothetical protein